jgi:hypothetical protein
MAVAIDCLLSCRMTNAHKFLQFSLVKGHGERRLDQKAGKIEAESGMRIDWRLISTGRAVPRSILR